MNDIWLSGGRFGCSRSMVTLSGMITGVSGPAAGISLNVTADCGSQTVLTDALGNYCFRVAAGACMTITPGTGVGVTVTPENYTLCPVCQSMANLNFTLAPVTPTTVTVSGIVSGLVNNAGIQVNYSVNGQSLTTVTGAGGLYAFTAPLGSNIVITPSAQAGFNAAPTGYTINNIAADTSNQNFLYTALTTTFTIGGTISGLTNNTGIQVPITVNGISSLTVTDNFGNFIFTVPRGANVVLAAPNITGFDVAPLNFQLNNVLSNISGRNFVFTQNIGAFSVSGFVFGLTNNVGIPVNYTVNGQPFSTSTAANGFYIFTAPTASSIVITPIAQPGFTVTPSNYTIPSLGQDVFARNFTYTAV